MSMYKRVYIEYSPWGDNDSHPVAEYYSEALVHVMYKRVYIEYSPWGTMTHIQWLSIIVKP